MKITLSIIAVIGIALLISSCTNKTKKQESEIITIDPNELIPGPIQHEDLSENQLTKIKLIHKTFEEVYPITLEETITNFKRDLNIDREINLWIKMKETFENVLNEKQYDKVEERKEVFKIIFMSTMMPKNKVKSNVEIKELSENDADYILSEFEKQMNK
ncbi:hypothetical protein [Tenacibaculum caenipelagi]|uniref:Lipoprotein n=1 Tax=Tenacibaculum caenipelagi TaxID=1325435 RepID=A0A4R6TFH9_9FLAO|nr:hypothetical protein [Tenacibaculum caenipelagi]TDQ27530.1 hypothetical protein DFQ07_1381 [Tenacibaculum caenipelagi]